MIDDHSGAWSDEVINSIATIRDDDILGPDADLDAQRLLEHILASGRVSQPSDRRAARRSHGKRRRVGLSASLVAAAAVVVLLVLLVFPGSGGARSAAAAVLEQAATAAAQQPTPGPGQYLYTETQTEIYQGLYQDNTLTATSETGLTDQSWTDDAGDGQQMLTLGTPDYPTAADSTAWGAHEAANGGITVAIASSGYPEAEAPLVDVANLPTDPSQLTAVIAAQKLVVHTQGSGQAQIPGGAATILDDGWPYSVFEGAAALLLGPTKGMTPALASALFQVMADQPGVQLLGTVTDHDGQQGQAVSLPTTGTVRVSEVVVDPASGQLLEARFALPPSTLPAHQTCGGPEAVTTTTCVPSTGDSVGTDPIWIDVVARGVVNLSTATVPAAGSVQPTVTLVPGAPTGLTATQVPNPNGPGTVQLSWTSPTNVGAGPITDYIVREATEPGGFSLYDTHSNSTSFTWTGGRQDGSFAVQAVNADGYGPASTFVNPTQ